MKKSVLYPLLLYILVLIFWIIAWLFKLNVLENIGFFASPFGSFLYWILAKLLIWILPYFVFFRHKFYEIIADIKTNDKNWLKWGVLIGGAIAILNIIYNIFTRQRIFAVEFSYAFINVAITAPLLEEILFRGFILNLLKEKLPFYIANIISSVCFLALHIPGWFFMGVIKTNLLNMTFVSIFILSLIFGYAYKNGNSIKASIIVHLLNNIT